MKPIFVSLLPMMLKLLTELELKSAALFCHTSEGVWCEAYLAAASYAGVSTCIVNLQPDEPLNNQSLGNKTGEEATRVVGQCMVDQLRTSVVIGTAQQILGTIQSAIRWELYSKSLHWVTLQNDVKSFRPREFPVDSFPLLKWTTFSLSKELLTSWHARRLAIGDQGFEFKDIGVWPKSNGTELIKNVKNDLIPPTYTDFRGKTITLSGGKDLYSSFGDRAVIACYYDSDQEIRCTGYVGELMTVIASSLKLRIGYKKGGPCGTSEPKTSRIYDVVTQAADLTIGTCVLTHDRAKVAKGLEWFELQGVFIGTAALKTIQEPFLIVNIFQAQVWILVIVAAVASSLAFLLVQKTLREPGILTDIPVRALLNQSSSSISSGNNNGSNNRSNNMSSSNSVSSINIISNSMTSNNSNITSNSINNMVTSGKTSVRCLVVVTWCFAIPLLALYGGNLTAMLTSPTFEAPVDSLSDLAVRPDKTPILFHNDPIHQMLKNKTGVLGAVFQKATFGDDVTFIQWSRKILYGDLAIINSRRAIIHLASQVNQEDGLPTTSSCHVKISDDSISYQIITFLGHKNSEFEEAINKRIRQLRSFGITGKLYQAHIRDGCSLQTGRRGRDGSSAQRLNLKHLQGVFWVYIFGNTTATAVFFFEKMGRRVLSVKNGE